MNNPKGRRAIENMQQGARTGSGEGLSYTYFDTLDIAAGIRDHRFFAVAQGQGLPVPKTAVDTNMRQSAQIPQGHKMFVNSLGFEYYGDGIKDEVGFQKYEEWIHKTVLSFKMPGKDDQGLWPLSQVVGNLNLITVVPSVPGDNIVIPKNVYNNWMKLEIPIPLPALETFEVKLISDVDPDATQVSDRIRFYLKGYLGRLN